MGNAIAGVEEVEGSRDNEERLIGSKFSLDAWREDLIFLSLTGVLYEAFLIDKRFARDVVGFGDDPKSGMAPHP